MTNQSSHKYAGSYNYADDLCLATQSTSFTTIESRLTDALHVLTEYYNINRNSLNANTQVCAFHLNNHQANTKLNIIWNGQTLNMTIIRSILELLLTELSLSDNMYRTSRRR